MMTYLTPNQGDESVSTPGDSREPAEVGAIRASDGRGGTLGIGTCTHRDGRGANPTRGHTDRGRCYGVATGHAAPLEP